MAETGGAPHRWRAFAAGSLNYVSEIRIHWRPLLAALIGLGAGLSFATTTASVMGPHLVAEFGWARADYAAVSSLTIFLLIAIPIIGRLADLIGVRRTALIGVITLPLLFVSLSMMRGDIQTYAGLMLVKTLVCGTTTATVYSRVVVQHVEKARGLALALVASGPALSTAFIGPLLNEFVEANGWRAGYLALAAFTGGAGALALLIMPPDHGGRAHSGAGPLQRTRDDYSLIAKSRAFWILLAAMLLCNLPQVIALSQLNLVMLENGLPTSEASIMLTAFAAGTLLGRFVCGVALDRFSAPIVAAVSMGLPAVGLLLLSSSLDAPPALAAAIFIIGLSYGAEGDLLGFLVVRQFGVRIYSTVLGLVTAAISVSIASGALLLSLTLSLTDSFTLFQNICAVAVITGALLLLMLRGPPAEADAAAPAPVSATE